MRRNANRRRAVNRFIVNVLRATSRAGFFITCMLELAW